MTGTSGKERWIVISLALAGFIATLDDYIVSVSLPVIAKDFDATTSEASLVIMAYLLSLVATLLLFGRLGDRIGHRRVFLAGYATFVLGSAMCAIAPTLAALVGFRVFQGLGAAMLSVTGPALIASAVGGSRRGWAFGIFTTVTALGITLGAPLGGILTGLLSWHFVFAVNVPIGVIAAVVAWRVLPADGARGTWRWRGFDLTGAALSTLGLLSLLIGFNQGEELGGWTAPPVLGLFAAAAVLLAAFVWWELRVPDPLVDLRDLRDPVLAGALIGSLAGYMLLAGCNFLLPFYLIYAKGLKPEQVGVVMIAYSVVYVAASPWAGRASDRFTARRVSIVGMVAAAGASALMVLIVGWVGGVVLVIVYLVWRAASYALFIAPNNALVMSASSADGHGRTSGLLKISVNLSLVLGLVLFETLFALPIAEGLGSLSSMIAQGQVDTATMQTGFRLAYGFGIIVCLAAAVATVMARRGAREGRRPQAHSRNHDARLAESQPRPVSKVQPSSSSHAPGDTGP